MSYRLTKEAIIDLLEELGLTDSSFETIIRRSIIPRNIYPTGKVICYDDFSSALLKWYQDSLASPIGGGISRSTVYALTDDASMRIQSGTVANAGYHARVQFGELPSDKMKIGVEFDFMLENSDEHFIAVLLDHYDGVNCYRGTIRYTGVVDRWQSRGINWVWKDLIDYEPAAMDLVNVYYPWHHLKIKFDLVKHTYLGNFIIDHHSIDIDGNSLTTFTSTSVPNTFNVDLCWWNESGVTTNRSLWVDNVIITMDEET